MSEKLRSCECETEQKVSFSSLYYIFSQIKTFKVGTHSRHVAATSRDEKPLPLHRSSDKQLQQVGAPAIRLTKKSPRVQNCVAQNTNQFEFVRLVTTTKTCRLSRKQRFSEKNLQYEAISLLQHLPQLIAQSTDERLKGGLSLAPFQLYSLFQVFNEPLK